MSTQFRAFPKLPKPLFVAMSAAGFLATAACSTDVQRFGQSGGSSTAPTQMGAPTTVASAPLAPLQTNAVQSQPAPMQRYADVRPAANPQTAAGGMIRVGTGDTLYSLSRAHGVRVEDMAAANGIRFPYHVRFGQQLRLPGNAPRTVASNAPVLQPVARPAAQAAPQPYVAPVAARQVNNGSVHVVQPKETLYSVSRTYRVNVKDLAAFNGLSMSTGLKIGQRLTIPTGPVNTRQVAAVGGPLNPVKAAPKNTVAPVVAIAPVIAPKKVATAKPSESIGPLAAPAARSSSQFRWPVRGRLISRFGPKSDGGRNDGVNIAVPVGTSVKAAENGVVAYPGSELKGYGNLVLIRHSGDWVTAYAHNSEILVERGATVKRGQIIAKAGKSGSVSKPQVHFEVRKGAKAVDPLSYLDGA